MDALSAHQRPKLEIYGDTLFVVVRTASLQDRKIRCGETHIFAGRGYVVTVRHGSTTAYKEVRTRCEGAPKMLAMGDNPFLLDLIRRDQELFLARAGTGGRDALGTSRPVRSLRSREFIISWLNHTPHATAVYASCSASPPPHATLATRRLARPYLGRTCTG
jgi:hypothetical protein